MIFQSHILKILVIYFLTWKRDFSGESLSYRKLVSFLGAHFIHFSLGTIVCRENLIILMRLLPGHSHVLCILTSSNSFQWSRIHRLDIFQMCHHRSSTFSHVSATDRLLLDSLFCPSAISGNQKNDYKLSRTRTDHFLRRSYRKVWYPYSTPYFQLGGFKTETNRFKKTGVNFRNSNPNW